HFLFGCVVVRLAEREHPLQSGLGYSGSFFESRRLRFETLVIGDIDASKDLDEPVGLGRSLIHRHRACLLLRRRSWSLQTLLARLARGSSLRAHHLAEDWIAVFVIILGDSKAR